MPTIIVTAENFREQFDELLGAKENPEEWYVLIGSPVAEYNVNIADVPEELQGDVEDEPEWAEDSTENVPGFYQIGVAGWGEQMFEGDANFVMEYQDSPHGKLDSRLLHTLLVHESMLKEDAIAVANGEMKPDELDANA